MNVERTRFPTGVLRLVVCAAVASAAVSVPGASDGSAINPRTIADCDRAVERDPESFDAWGCYFEVGRRRSLWLEVEARLNGMLAVRPEHHYAQFALGLLLAYRPNGDPVTPLEAASVGFENRGEHVAAFRAGEALFRTLANLQLREDADRTFERLGTLAEQARGDPDIEARWAILQAGRALWQGAVAEAEARLSRALDAGPEDGLVARIENGLGRAAWAQGRMADAQTHFVRATDIYRRRGDDWAEANELYNVALAAGRRVAAGEETPGRVAELTDQLLAVALESGNVGAEAQARLLRAQVPTEPLDRRIDEADHALADLRTLNLTAQRCFAMRLAANLRVERDDAGDHARAIALLDEAAAVAREHGSLDDEARTWIVRANLGRSRSAPERRESMYRAVEVVERIRDLRPDGLVRGRYLWDWAFVYHRLVGSLLRDGEPPLPSESEIDAAVRVLERFRSRRTLDTLDAANATTRSYRSDDARSARRGDVLEEIARVQTELSKEGGTDDEVGSLSARLRRLDIEEAALREAIARHDVAFARLRMVEPAGIPEIRELLHDDEALIAFQSSTRESDGVSKRWWNGGSWAIVITHDDARAVPVPDADLLRERIELLLGLIRRDDPLHAEASARVYADVLADAIDGLPRGVRRLVLVPDGDLGRIPFDALRPAPGRPPLSTRFAITQVPSASAWIGWRASPAEPGGGVLSFADPVPAGGPRAAERSPADRLGRLPEARIEGRQIADALGGRRRVRVGPAATEAAFKADLPFDGAIVHLAAHAVVHDREPARTAVLLAPGGGTEDGLLQLREIVALPLTDKIVLLSACSGAGGEVAHGEGVVGLAHGFFQAGARTVVAGMWPVRDQDARRTMVAVAGHLARGLTVSDAVAQVRREAITTGLPPSAWAGWVVLGDGDVRVLGPERGAGQRPDRFALWTGAALLASCGAGIGLWLRRRPT